MMMKKSKLPVFRAQAASPPDLPLPVAKKPCPRKPVVPLYSRDPNIAFSSGTPKCVVFKAGSNGKKSLVSSRRGPPTQGLINHNKMVSELKDQNQLLEAENASLHNNLVNAQNTIQEMSEQQESLKKELKELQGRLEKNMILQSRNIDPGEHITAADETSKVKETKAFTENLLTELKVFTVATKEQKRLIQTMTAKWNEAEESRNLFLREQEAFQSDLERFQLSLERAEKWLDF
ncbi:small kinetochore-associated protein [Rhinoderma darwinii]|uniref:small kinetochore-associated protein n=1 Tax=Rhinoderma darwinii TaxID=43563 RepID=UPI003F678373